ncbi:MAG: response regulator [Terriglobia bacterium]
MARLLIVDKEESLCRVLESAFRKKGHLVDTVSNGQAAKKKIESLVYDLIISAIRMPDITGIELLEYARATRNPAAFILMTAVPTVSTAAQALNLGAYRYVIKTDRLLEELNLTVERALEELALREENLPLRLAHLAGSVTGVAPSGDETIQIPPEGIDFESHVAQVEKQYLQAALQSAGGVRRQAADLLKMSYRSFSRHAKKYGI